MFGREAKMFIDLVFQEVGIQTFERQSHKKFAQEWGHSMKKVYEIARDNIRKSVGYNKKQYDQKARTVEIKVGDMVLVWSRVFHIGTLFEFRLMNSQNVAP